jgi:lipopolysaccharide export system protein LptC
MNSSRSALRFRLAVILAITGFLALSSFWLSMVIMRSPSDARIAEQRTEPDYFVFNFDCVKMLINGKPHYHLTGSKLTHYPFDDSYLIDMPAYNNLDESKPPQFIRSDRAIAKDDNTKVHMYGNVLADRTATQKTESLRLETEYLLVFPDEDAMETDKQVVIHRGTAIINGVGMYANNATGEMRLLHETSVVIAPKQ